MERSPNTMHVSDRHRFMEMLKNAQSEEEKRALFFAHNYAIAIQMKRAQGCSFEHSARSSFNSLMGDLKGEERISFLMFEKVINILREIWELGDKLVEWFADYREMIKPFFSA